MTFLDVERETLEGLLPGLDAALAGFTLAETERPENPAIAAFFAHGGGGLLIPRALGGAGATPLQALRAQRAIGARSPSLAVASNMHHLTIASFIEVEDLGADADLLAMIAQEKIIIANGFAEGRPGASIQSSNLDVKPAEGGVIVNGRKRPCSLARSMQMLAISLPPPEGVDAGLAAAIMPAATPGVSWKPFWSSPILAGAESDEIVLEEVFIPDDAIMPLGGSGRSEPVQDRAFMWFELMISGVYLGMASRLLELALAQVRTRAVDLVALASELEGAMAALEGVARAMEAGERRNRDLGRVVLVRYAVQGAIERATNLAVEALGGNAFIGSGDVAYLLAASRGLGLHPPARATTSERLADFLRGAEFVVD